VVNAALLVASYVFYGWVTPWFCVLLAMSTALDFTVAVQIERYPAHKRGLLMCSLVGNLGVLGAFKYHDFFVAEVGRALAAAGVQTHLGTLNLIVPVGISFYTFQTLSYAIDVYRGRLPACRSVLDFALYVAFFPQLVAGPIERATHLLPQVQRDRVITPENVARGASLAVWGAFQKVCVGDVLGAYVDQVQLLREPSASLVWAGAIAFGGQILADFSGYTDMARGTARMLGFELIRNFHYPYLAVSTPDFWRRWHISLSEWIRDYLFEPLMRRGRPSLARTAMVTWTVFFLVGLWHGPQWNFILLGLWHGTAMVAYTVIVPLLPYRVRNIPGGRWIAIALHHALVLIPGGILFREPDVARSLSWFLLPPLGGTSAQHLSALYIVIVSQWVSLSGLLYVPARGWILTHLRGTPWIWPVRATLWTVGLLAVITFSSSAPADFIYFQF
jgi:D-alanyl-lipoteichoic acid acyltransferase DltB (MBOAT superfamily)